MHRAVQSILLICVLALLACTADRTETLYTFPVNSLDNVIAPKSLTLDDDVSSDGNGSFRIDLKGYGTIPLYVIDSIGVDDCRLIYRARVRTRDLDGAVYLEMLCHFPGKGEYFSRNLDQVLSGTNDWIEREAVFFLQKGQIPDTVRLNVGLSGSGTVWIDDIKLLKAPLN